MENANNFAAASLRENKRLEFEIACGSRLKMLLDLKFSSDAGAKYWESYDHGDHSSFWMIFLPPLMRPVLLAAIRPTFLPLEVSLLMVDG